jgi:hypothetical protein
LILAKSLSLIPKSSISLRVFFLSRVRLAKVHFILRALSLLGVCFIAEDPKEREHLRKILSGAAPKLLPIELRHSDRSQDEDANRLKDGLT